MSLSTLIKSLDGGEILLPKLRAFLVKENELILQKKIRKEDIEIVDAKMARKALFDRIRERREKKNQILEGEFFHPSALGVCMRLLWFDAMHAPRQIAYTGETLLKEHMIFEGGTYIHIMFQNLCERAGFLVQREVPIKNLALKILGHADGKLLIDGEYSLLEIKTINSRQFTGLGNRPKDAHVKQMTSYMKALGLKLGIIIYLEKDSHKVKEFVVRMDEGFFRREIAPRQDYYFRSVRKKIMPFREGANPKKMPCSFCQFTRVCWETDATKKFLNQIGAKEEK